MSEKKPYQAPQVFRVELSHDQAILTTCSVMTMAAQNMGMGSCFSGGFLSCKALTLPWGDKGPRSS